MLYQIKSYLQFLSRSTNQHGVHSPFVFDLITKCFYDRTKYSGYQVLWKHRKALFDSKEAIEVTDYGAGSRVFKTNHRTVAAIARNAGVSRKRQKLLFRLSQYLQPKNSLELGTSLGLGSLALAIGNPEGILDTVEGCPETSAVAASLFEKFEIKNTTLHVETFEDFFSKNKRTFDLIYVDGNHSKQRTLDYFNTLLGCVHNDTVVVFDDIYWSPEMTAAWKVIKENSQVTVSIDTFQWGLIFFRSEQEKEHFSIRL